MLRLDPEIRAMKAEVRRHELALRKEAKKGRPKSEKADRGRERDNGYLAYLRRQPCRIGMVRPGTCDGPIEACHVRYGEAMRGKVNAGLQCKPSDRYATSCCSRHHREQHSHGNERAWWGSYGLDGLDAAESQFKAYRDLSR